jgi:PGM1 C-terminal domain
MELLVRDPVVLQRRLAPVWRMSQPPGGAEHVRVVLPSYNLGESAFEHYARRLPALEHRYLVDILQLSRVEGCTLVFVLSQAPEAEVVDYYLSLLPGCPSRLRNRIHTVVVAERSARPLSAKLRDRPDLLADIRRFFGGRPAYIEPWNVTDNEVAIALALQAPLNGTAPHLWPLGFKSAGRRLFAAAGVPSPPGFECQRTADDVESSISRLRDADPMLRSVVVKLDNSVAGDGNMVVPLRAPDGSPSSAGTVGERVASLPTWYLSELRSGGVVEAYVTDDEWSSPSVQLQITPDRHAAVLATHEQVLGGENGQVYLGCRFPARRDYAARLATYGRRVGQQLARCGVVGMLSVDFVAGRQAGGPWALYALEVNLRRGGTTAPMVVLSSLLPGRLDGRGRWRLADGSARFYSATDNLLDERWVGLPPGRVIEAVRDAGLAFDPRTGTGVVLHMLSGMAVDGRFGMTAVGRSVAEASEMYSAVRPVVDSQCEGGRRAAERLDPPLVVTPRTGTQPSRPSVR